MINNTYIKPNKILEKIKKIENTYDLLSEMFSNDITNEKDYNFKYFILTIFFQRKSTQLSFYEVWKLFKVLVSVNDNLIKEKSDTNELYAICLENCAKLLLKGLINLKIDTNFGFKNEEINVLFDFLFSLPLVKHFVNFVESQKQKEGIHNLLDQIGKLIFVKIKISQNDIIKNIFNSFYHFLNLKEINNYENENKNISVQPISKDNNNTIIPKKSETKFKNLNLNDRSYIVNDENVNIMNLQTTIPKDYSNNNILNSQKLSQICNSKISEKQNNKTKAQKELTNGEPKKKSVKNNDEKKLKNNMSVPVPVPIPLISKRKVNEEINNFKKCTKELVDKVNKFINFEEMKKSIKEKLPGNCLLQIGSFLYDTPYPDLTNINVDLLIQKQNNGNYNIKKYFDTFETFKNIPNTKSSFFCLNKDQYFYDCLEKNKSFFHLTRTDMDESTIQSIYNFKTVTVHLYAYNKIYHYSSFFFKKLYSTVKNLWKLHLFYEKLLLRELPILKSNYELCLLILNFLQSNYKVFSEKIEDKNFTYFAYDRSKKYGYLTNYPLVMQYKTLYFFEYDEKRINFIKKLPVLELAKEFHKFLCKYLEYIYNDGNLFDKKDDLNFSRDNYFLDIKYIFNRHFLDENLICYKNTSSDEFTKIKNLFSSIYLE